MTVPAKPAISPLTGEKSIRDCRFVATLERLMKFRQKFYSFAGPMATDYTTKQKLWPVSGGQGGMRTDAS